MEMKDIEMLKKILDLARELKEPWNMKVTLLGWESDGKSYDAIVRFEESKESWKKNWRNLKSEDESRPSRQ